MLTPNELDSLIIEYNDKMTTKTRKNRISEEIYNSTKGVMYAYTKKYKLSCIACNRLDEYESALNLAFAKALKSYNTDADTRFTTYLTTVAVNEAGMLMRKTTRMARDMCTLDVLVEESDRSRITYMDGVVDMSAEQELEQVSSDVATLLDWLVSFSIKKNRERDREICEMYFVQGYNQTEIGTALGMNRSNVSRTLTRAAKKAAARDNQFLKEWFNT